jgi:hypothetical protein
VPCIESNQKRKRKNSIVFKCFHRQKEKSIKKETHVAYDGDFVVIQPEFVEFALTFKGSILNGDQSGESKQGKTRRRKGKNKFR